MLQQLSRLTPALQFTLRQAAAKQSAQIYLPCATQVRTIAKNRLAKRKRYVWRPWMEPVPIDKERLRMRLILTEDVEGFGSQGQLVFVQPEIGRRELVLQRKAVYALPENLEGWGISPEQLDTFEEKKDAEEIPRAMLDFLASAHFMVKVPLLQSTISDARYGEENADTIVLTKHDICQQLAESYRLHVPVNCMRVKGIAEHESIRRPGEYEVQLTINGSHRATVPMQVKAVYTLESEEDMEEES